VSAGLGPNTEEAIGIRDHWLNGLDGLRVLILIRVLTGFVEIEVLEVVNAKQEWVRVRVRVRVVVFVVVAVIVAVVAIVNVI